MNRVSICLNNGLSPIRREAIISTNAGLLSIEPLGANFSEILFKNKTFHSRQCIRKYRLRKGGHFAQGQISLGHRSTRTCDYGSSIWQQTQWTCTLIQYLEWMNYKSSTTTVLSVKLNLGLTHGLSSIKLECIMAIAWCLIVIVKKIPIHNK